MSRAGADSGSPEGDSARAGSARRLTLSPIGFDIVLALSQVPAGLRLADIAHVISSPVSSVQTALRILAGNAIVERIVEDPPRYRLAPDHPARAELASLATVLPEPERAIGILVRANPGVTFAGVDDVGFVVAVVESDGGAAAALHRHLDLVAGARTESPNVVLMTEPELRRIARVAPGLRARVADAIVLKGAAPTKEQGARRVAG